MTAITDPNGPIGVVTEKAARLILEYEGFDNGSYPGGDSGVTIGHGYDLGYHTPEEFAADWKPLLSSEDYTLLLACIGLKGDAAKARAASLKGKIKSLTREGAGLVFRAIDLPRWEDRARKALPGFDSLPEDTEGAMVSLIFNRGARMTDANPSLKERREMRIIRADVAMYATALIDRNVSEQARLLGDIATQLRSMKRLWIGKGLDGLLRRRDAEALLVESTAPVAS